MRRNEKEGEAIEMRCDKSEVWEWERVTGDVTKVKKQVNGELYVCVCVCVYVRVFMCVYVHVCVCVYVRVHKNVRSSSNSNNSRSS